ncbi:hypothetical protein MMC20_006990 [Loxospora ochrophaea]|nr:hypothetical protein [Loxospora ochrophaea]
MASWRDEYLAALQVRDAREKSTKAVYDAYTKLADRSANLYSSSSIDQSPAIDPAKPQTQSKSRKTASAETSPPSPAGLASLAKVREDLAEAQRGRGELLSRLTTLTSEFEKLKLRAKSESKRCSELASERASLAKKMKDRDEELRGKTKLLDDVHDETVSLTLQLNIADDNIKKLQQENKELVDRWMTRMGQEADAMNRASRFS